MSRVFKTIIFPDQTDDKVKETLQKGYAIQVVKHTYELGDFRKGDILKTTWNDLVVISNAQTYDISTYQKTVTSRYYYEKYGNIDILDINKVCSLLYFIPTPTCELSMHNPDRYQEVGIINSGLVYYCNGFNDRNIQSFTDREDELIQRRAMYIHAITDTTSLINQYYIGVPAIEYVLRVTGFIRRKRAHDFGKESGDMYFTKYEQLYHFFKNGRRF